MAEPTAADAELASQRWPGTTQQQLAEGRKLYVRRCSGCHSLWLPEQLPPQRWLIVVDEMEKEGVVLSPPEHEAISRYLYGVSGRTSSAKP